MAVYSESEKKSLPNYTHQGSSKFSSEGFTEIKYSSETSKQLDQLFSWYIPASCLKEFKTLKIGKILGSGRIGSVYSLCDSTLTTCDKIVKIIPLMESPESINLMLNYTNGFMSPEDYLNQLHFLKCERKRELTRRELRLQDDFEREVDITRFVSDLGIGPKFHSGSICSDVLDFPDGFLTKLGFIIMDRWDMSVENYFEEYAKPLPPKIFEKLENLINRLHKADIVHNDLGPKNVVINLDRNKTPIDIALIDFGESRSLRTQGQSNVNDLLSLEYMKQESMLQQR